MRPNDQRDSRSVAGIEGMWPESEVEASGLPGAEVRSALETWRSGLVDLTGANPLLNFARIASSSVEITGPSPKAIVKVLQEGSGYAFENDGSAHVLRTDLPDEVLGALLHRFYRRSRAELQDRGVSPLYL